LGRCLKVGDLAAHYSDADYVVWLAIDNVTEQTLADRQITALLFHELLHVQEVLDKEGNPTGKRACASTTSRNSPTPSTASACGTPTCVRQPTRSTLPTPRAG
jgi:hypothetical protein